MKIGPILVQYLLRNKILALQGLGVFSIDDASNPVYDAERQQYSSPIQFQAEPKASEDPELINFIVEQTGKIKPLAIADLDSYLAAGKQLLNISKPFVIEGLGTLNRNSQNNIEFIAGTVASQVTEEGARHGKTKSVESNDAINFHDNYLKPPKSADNMTRKLLIATAVLVGIAIIGWVVYFFLYHEESPAAEPPNRNVVSQPQVTRPDTVAPTQSITTTDSVKPKKDSIAAAPEPKPPVNSSPSYNIVIEYAGKERALKRYAQLRDWETHIQLATKDSVQFKLYFSFTGPLSDTTHKKDSLSKYYGRKTFVELNP